MANLEIKLGVQKFGRFLSNMVMPNIGAFIAWGFITAIFIPEGWWPNETISSLVVPMRDYLLPLLLGYTGGKLVYGDRGALVGAITTMGVIVGSSMPMFLGAMVVGPLSGFAMKEVDKLFEGKVKSGFEMLVNNFSAGILGIILAILALFAIGPLMQSLSQVMESGVEFLVKTNLLPLTSIIIEPAKVFFLNNAINHGIFTPLGINQVAEQSKSIFFLIEANPGPGLGLLLAYMLFGKGSAKDSAGGAAIIQFFGGIHEIYFPYVLMNPLLLIAMILSGMIGVLTLTFFDAGLVAPASPGSIIAVLAVAPKGSIVGVLISVTLSALVSFFASAFILKISKGNEQNLEEAKSNLLQMKGPSLNDKVMKEIDFKNIKKIIVACDAGMGSSAMGAGVLKKKIEKEGLPIFVANSAINSIPVDADIIITHKDLTERAKTYNPKSNHLSISNFLDKNFYDNLVERIKEESQDAPSQKEETVKASSQSETENVFHLEDSNVLLNLEASNKEEVIRFLGGKLEELGYVKPKYVEAMLAREALSPTYLGEGIAVPHGTNEAKGEVIKTGVIFAQYPKGVLFGEDEDDKAYLIIAVAAKGNEHLQVINKLTNALDDPQIIEKLISTKDKKDILTILS